jgi:RarD protein
MGAVIKIVCVMIIWGSIGIFVRYTDLPSVELGFVRALISSMVLFMIRGIFIKESFLYKPKSILLLIASGAALGLNWVFLFRAFKGTTIANATISYYMAPIFVVLLARFFLKEALSVNRILSLIVAVAGMVLILGQSQATGPIEIKSNLGIIYGLIAAVFYAIVILVNGVVKDISSLDKTLIQIISATLVLLPVVIFRKALIIEGTNTWLMILLIGIVHTTIPYLVYFDNLKKISVSKAAILSYIDPFTAFLLGYLVLKEHMTIYQVIGGLMIMLSVFNTLRGSRLLLGTKKIKS